MDLPRWMIRVGTASWYFVGICVAVTLVAFIFAASRDIAIPLVLGIVLAVVFAPHMDWLTSRGLRTSVSAGLIVVFVIIVGVGVVIVVTVGLSGQGQELAGQIDEATDEVKAWVGGLDIGTDVVDRARDSVNASTETVSAGLASGVVGVINSATGLVTGTILGLVVFYYLLKDGQMVVDNFISSRSAARQASYRRIAGDAAVRIQAFARGRTIMAAINGVTIGLAAAAFGVPMAIAIAVVNFVGAYIPYLGAFVGGAFAFLLALSTGGLPLALTMVVVALAVNLLLENALEPVLLGDQLDLHPLVVLLATVIGGLLAGMVGLILAAPLTAIGLNIYREIKATGFFD